MNELMNKKLYFARVAHSELTVHSQKRYRLVASCQFYRLVETCQEVATSWSISSSCNKYVKIRLVATFHADLLQLAEASCNKPVEIINLQQAC